MREHIIRAIDNYVKELDSLIYNVDASELLYLENMTETLLAEIQEFRTK